MGVQVGIDVGGTFTDFVLFDVNSQRLVYLKIPSTRPPDLGVLAGFHELSERLGISLGEIERVVHGSTVATNALLEHSWAKTALITTEGFRDVLEIGRQDRPKLYDWFADRPEPLVPRTLRFEVPERVDASGNVLRPLDEQRVSELAATLRGLGVEAVAVCFLFSYLNPRARAPREGDPRTGAGRARRPLERRPPRGPRIRAGVHDRDERRAAARRGRICGALGPKAARAGCGGPVVGDPPVERRFNKRRAGRPTRRKSVIFRPGRRRGRSPLRHDGGGIPERHHAGHGRDEHGRLAHHRRPGPSEGGK